MTRLLTLVAASTAIALLATPAAATSSQAATADRDRGHSRGHDRATTGGIMTG